MYILLKKKDENSTAFDDYAIEGYARTEENAVGYVKENGENLHTFRKVPAKCYDKVTEEKVYAAAAKAAEDLYTVSDNGIEQEMYVDRGDEILSTSTLKQIMESDDPENALYDIIYENYADAEYDMKNQTAREITHYLNKQGINDETVYDYVLEYVEENICINYDMSTFLNVEYKVDILLDTGNANYDFCCDNLLNYAGGDKTSFDENSSVKWLAEQFNKLDELQSAIKNYQNEDNAAPKDQFVASVIQELENNSCSCSSIVFLAKLSLSDLIELRKAIKRKDKTSYITLAKETETGLFDCISGGGSVLEIELPDKVNVPCDKIHDAWIDGTKQHWYDVDEVYGLIGSVWDKANAEIHINEQS